MRKIFRNNQVIITALAIMIAIAGYLNFSDMGTEENGQGEVFEAMDVTTSEESMKPQATDVKIKATQKSSVTKAPVATKQAKAASSVGDAVLVNSSIGLNYFYSAKLNREQTRAKSKEDLMKIVENASASEKQKETALNEIISLSLSSEKESAAEMMLQAKGFENVVVSLLEGKADVVVDSAKITSEQVAQIEDIVKRKTGVEAENIVITPVNSKK